MLKKILPYVKNYKWHAIFSPIMMVLEVLADIIIPFLMANIVNIGIANRDGDYVLRMGFLMIGVAIFGGAMGTISSHLGATAGYGTAFELRKKAYRSVQAYSFNNIDEMSIPSLITRLTSDAETAGQIVMMSLRMAFRSPFLFVFALIFSFKVDSELAIIFLVAVPIIVTGIVILFRKAAPLFDLMRVKLDDLNAVIQEQLNGIRVIKTFNRQPFAHDEYTEKNASLRDTSIKALKIVLFMQPMLIAAIYACMTAVLWFGGIRVYNGTLQAGTIIAFLTYVGQIMMSLMMLTIYIINLTYGRAALKRIFQVIDTNSEIYHPEDPIHELEDGSVVFNHVNFKYPGYRDNILDDINLRFESGSQIGIVGSTGSSKSTLVQMIPRLYEVNEGEVIVGSHNVKDYDLEALREQIAMVLQKNTLVSGTIRSNMQWGDEQATDEEIITALKRAQAWEFVSQYPDILDHVVEQGGSNYSGGQRQRLTIARALLKHPKILILDDSTSAVDTDTDARIRRMIRTELPGVTTIIIAQRIDSIKGADQIVVMDEGRVDATGTHDELMESSHIYRDIHESQERGLEG